MEERRTFSGRRCLARRPVVDGARRGRDPVQSAERFLTYLSDIERSPNTVKAYAHDLKDWLGFLARRHLAVDPLPRSYGQE